MIGVFLTLKGQGQVSEVRTQYLLKTAAQTSIQEPALERNSMINCVEPLCSLGFQQFFRCSCWDIYTCMVCSKLPAVVETAKFPQNLSYGDDRDESGINPFVIFVTKQLIV